MRAMARATTIVVEVTPELDLITGPAAADILRTAERAHQPGEFGRVLAILNQHADVVWRPFGGDSSRVPHSALGAANDPAHLLAEPVMNSFDALFELQMLVAELSGDPPSVPASPRDAAHQFYGVPAAGLAVWDARKGVARRRHDEIAQLTQAVIKDGSRKSTPTFVFRDEGIGQHPSDFWRTILSLQLGNKIDIPYTAGQYGHGAGMLLGFTEGGQIMISRRHPKLRAEGQDDYAGLVLIRKRMPDETGYVYPVYECAVSRRTGNPFAFDHAALANPQWHGLQRTCIDYELPKPSFQFIYESLDHFLPHPPMPYELRDERNA
jgi:hypothetical protein